MKLDLDLKLKKTGKSYLAWWGWLAVAALLVIFGTVLAIHILTLPARWIPTQLVAPQAKLSPVTTDATISSNSSSVTPLPTSGLLVPIGQMGQSIVQGEFGLLVDQVVVLEPEAKNPNASFLVAVHIHLTNFQGSYYKVRNLAGSTFRLLALADKVNVAQSFSLVTDMRLAKQPVLEVAQNMQFGDIVNGWLTFQLTTVCKAETATNCPTLEFQIIPANASIPIRVKLTMPTDS